VLQPPPPPLPASSTLNSIPTNPPPPLPLLPPPTLQLQHQPQNKHQDTTNQTNYVIVNEEIDRKQKQQTADVNEKLTKLFESISAQRKNNSIEKELNNETTNTTNFNRPFKITPLLICTNETKNNKISITKNICNCNFCLLNLAYLNKNCSSHLLESNKQGVLNLTNKLSELDLIDYIDLNTSKTSSNNNNNQQSHLIRYRSSTPQTSLEREPKVNANEQEIPSSKCLGDEPIIYIDSIELDDHLNNSNSNTQGNNSNMNSFLAKLKSKQRPLTIFTEKNKEDEVATKSCSSKSTNNHDYHVIDENTELPSKVKLSPSNSVQSFEFIDHTQQNTPKCQLDETVKSYEKSWDDSATFLMEKLDKCLKQEQQQHLENRVKIIESNKNCTQCVSAVTPSSFFFNKPTLIPIKSITPIKLNCSLREKKLNALRNLNCGNLNRKSFHGQACLANEMSNVNLIVNSHHKQALNSSRLVSFNG
jgi:hypothetical protein